MRKLGLTLVPLVLLRAADVYALGLGTSSFIPRSISP